MIYTGFYIISALFIINKFSTFSKINLGIIMGLMIPDLDIKRDVPIVLNNISYEDSYSGDFTTRRAVIYTLGFTAKTYLYGHMSKAGVIKETQADMHSDTDVTSARESRIIVIPNPTTADADDDFGFTTTINFYDDTKKYNPSTDTDE